MKTHLDSHLGDKRSTDTTPVSFKATKDYMKGTLGYKFESFVPDC